MFITRRGAGGREGRDLGNVCGGAAPETTAANWRGLYQCAARHLANELVLPWARWCGTRSARHSKLANGAHLKAAPRTAHRCIAQPHQPAFRATSAHRTLRLMERAGRQTSRMRAVARASVRRAAWRQVVALKKAADRQNNVGWRALARTYRNKRGASQAQKRARSRSGGDSLISRITKHKRATYRLLDGKQNIKAWQHLKSGTGLAAAAAGEALIAPCAHRGIWRAGAPGGTASHRRIAAKTIFPYQRRVCCRLATPSLASRRRALPAACCA